MNSKIEQIIEEIEEYIESCKPQMFSGANIVVNKDELEELLAELKQKTPEEIRRYQKMLSNKDAILADARQKADQIVAKAHKETNELVSEHQIMQQAYAQANEIVMLATKQAQEILDKATMDANNIRESAISYTDDLLKGMQDTLFRAIEDNRTKGNALNSALQGYLDVVVNNRKELVPHSPAPSSEGAGNAHDKPEQEKAPEESVTEEEG